MVEVGRDTYSRDAQAYFEDIQGIDYTNSLSNLIQCSDTRTLKCFCVPTVLLIYYHFTALLFYLLGTITNLSFIRENKTFLWPEYLGNIKKKKKWVSLRITAWKKSCTLRFLMKSSALS